MTERNVVVLGGGIGGIVAARTLRRRVPRDVRITLVDREDTYTFAPSLLWLMSGERQPRQISRGRERLARKGIELVRGEAQGLDTERRTLRVDGRDLAFDHLVVALGVQPDPRLMPGLAEGGIDIYTVEGAIQAGRALRELGGGRVAVAITKLPYKCPAAPNEAAFLAETILRHGGKRAKVALYTPEPFPMPTAGEALGKALAGMLEQRGIELHTGRVLDEVDAGRKELVFQGGDRAGYDLLLAIPPHRTAEIVRTSGLSNEAGFIPVDRATLATEAGGVYAIGDVTQIPIAGGKFLPKAGVFAKAEAEVVATRIADELAGREPRATFNGNGSCFVDMGDGVAAFATGDFYAEGAPKVSLRTPSRRWHLAKVAFEKYWLARWA
ncbi:MAG: NAD(P)/FAD-dependent oxidoreductase [Actinobacteria bacterium]|nr:NAD(P)/FAD-dependent oxidoreductase [Actinomycetota bacterium]